MANVPLPGAATSVNYGWETTYGSAGTINKYFGHGQKIRVRRNNTAERVYGLGSREATATVAKQWAGSFTLDFIHSSQVANGGASFWKWVLGKVTDAGAGPYTHTFAYNTDFTLTSASLGIEFDQPTTDYEWTLLGSVVSTCTVRLAVNEPMKITIDGLYANETLDNTLTSVQAPAAADVPFEFALASVSYSSTLTRCSEFELVINNNPELIWGLGSREATAAIGKNVECNFRFTITYEASTWDALLYGASGGPTSVLTPAETATVTITVNNGLGTTNQRQVVFNLANAFINTADINYDPNEVVRVTYEGWTRTITSIVQTDNTNVTP